MGVAHNHALSYGLQIYHHWILRLNGRRFCRLLPQVDQVGNDVRIFTLP